MFCQLLLFYSKVKCSMMDIENPKAKVLWFWIKYVTSKETQVVLYISASIQYTSTLKIYVETFNINHTHIRSIYNITVRTKYAHWWSRLADCQNIICLYVVIYKCKCSVEIIIKVFDGLQMFMYVSEEMNG